MRSPWGAWLWAALLVACGAGRAAGGHCDFLEAFRVNFEARQRLSFGSTRAWYHPDSNAKHTPYVELDGADAAVSVGPPDTRHPFARDHYIEGIFVVDQTGAVVAAARFGPSGVRPVLRFQVPAGTVALTPYSYCNLHGYFRGRTAHPVATTGSPVACSLRECLSDPAAGSAGGCATLEALRVEAERRFGGEVKYDPVADAKHTPVVTVVGGVARISVGLGTVSGDSAAVHRQVDWLDGEKAHLIESLYALDASGAVVAYGMLSAADDPPAFEFPVPTGVTSITPYSLCNLHGLFRGDPAAVPAGGRLVESSCAVAVCMPPPPPAACRLFETEWASSVWRHRHDHGTAVPFYQPAGNSRHTPLLTADADGTATVVVGLTSDARHPTTPSEPHFIESVYLRDQSGAVVALARLPPDGPSPTAVTFDVPFGTSSLTPYSVCQKHGLFRGDAVPVNATKAEPAACAVHGCLQSQTGTGASCDLLRNLRAEAERRVGGAVKYDPAGEAKHTPVLVVSGATATVHVGVGAATGDSATAHLQYDVFDAAAIHVVEAVYVTDQDDNVVAYGRLSGLDNPPVLRFVVPTDVTQLTPFALCNVHGLFRGTAVAVAPAGQMVERECGVQVCLRPERPVYSCELLETERAAVLRRQLTEHSTAVPFFQPAANAKHTPTVRDHGDGTVTVEVGVPSAFHPTVSSDPHYIEYIYLVDQSDAVVGLALLPPTGPAPSAYTFRIPAGVTAVTPHALCQLHGLFRGAASYVRIPSGAAAVPCSAAGCLDHNNGTSGSDCPLFSALRIEAERRFGGVIKPPGTDAKHTPVVVVSGSRARVTVGLGTVSGDAATVHRQNDILDPSAVHVVESIYAVDQAGAVVAYGKFSGLDTTPVLEFDVPNGVTTVTPYALCNVHGLYRGDAVAATASTSVERRCAVDRCLRSVPVQVCELFEVQRTAALRRHRLDQSTAAVFFQPAGNPKHTPWLSFTGAVATVTVGTAEAPHPADAEPPHFIPLVYVLDQRERVVALFRGSPTGPSPPSFSFDVPSDVTTLTPYAHCNLHGLFRGFRHRVGSVTPRPMTCFVGGCGTDHSGGCTLLPALRAEAERLHGGNATYDPAGQAKHTPVLTVSGSSARITVGLGSVTGDASTTHRQSAAADPDAIHVVQALYATDQTGAVVAYAELTALDDPPAMSFDVPSDVTQLTPYELCNVHGLFRGSSVAVPQTGRRVERSCGVTACARPPPLPSPHCDLLEAFRVEFQHRHQVDHSTAAPFYQPAGYATHHPHLLVTGLVATIQVGTPAAPHATEPTEPHFIEAVYAVDQWGQVVAATRLTPTSAATPPGYSFEVPDGVRELTPYAFCNKHGLFRGDPAVVAGAAGRPVACSPGKCLEDPESPSGGSCRMLQSLAGDISRRAGAAKYDVTGMPSGTPVLIVSGDTARVGMGTGAATGDASTTFRQENPLDRTALRYTEALWAVDQNGSVVGWAQLSALDDPPTLSFVVPAGVTELTPHSMSNVHGHTRGDAVSVSAGSDDLVCDAAQCYAAGRRILPPLGQAQDNDTAEAETPAPTGACPAGVARSGLDLSFGSTRKFDCFVNVNDSDFGVSLHWAVDAAAKEIHFGVVAPGTGWVGMAFPDTPGRMVPAVAVIGWAGGCGEHTGAYDLRQQSVSGVTMGSDTGARVGLLESSAEEVSGTTFLRFRRAFCGVAAGTQTCLDPLSTLHLNFAYHPTADRIVQHPTDKMKSVAVVLADSLPPEPPAEARSCPASSVTTSPQGSAVYDCSVTVQPGWDVHWTWNADSSIGQFAVRSDTVGWVGVSLPDNPGQMFPARAVIGWAGGAESGTAAIDINNRDPSITDTIDLGIVAGTASCEEINGATVLRFALPTCSPSGRCWSPSDLNLNLARHDASDTFSNHGSSNRRSVSISLTNGAATQTATTDLRSKRRTHGVVLGVAWVALAPSAAFLSRYGKPVLGLGMSPRLGGKAAMLHISCGVAVMVLTIVGVVIAFQNWARTTGHSNGSAKYGHDAIGVTMFAGALFQPFVGVFMTAVWKQKGSRARHLVGVVHRTFGRMLVPLGIVQCFIGAWNLSALGDDFAQDFKMAACAVMGFWAGVFVICEVLLRVCVIRRRGIRNDAMDASNGAASQAELRMHCTHDDCWLAIEGRVYDVTDWLKKHPGGSGLLMRRAGRDATAQFNNVKHSDHARRLMSKMYVCDLEDSRTTNAVLLLEEVITCLVGFDVEHASLLIPEGANEHLSEGLTGALRLLVSTLEATLPFVPEYLRAVAGDAAQTDESEEELDHTVRPRRASAVQRAPPNSDTTGTVAICFTDIVSSTMLWETCPEGMSAALKIHNGLMRKAIAADLGYEVKTVGDAFMASFDSAFDACSFGLRVQTLLVRAQWPDALLDIPLCAVVAQVEDSVVLEDVDRTAEPEKRLWGGLRVRIGVHVGPAELEANPVTRRVDYFGPTVNKASRTEAAGSAGCVTITQEVHSELLSSEPAPSRTPQSPTATQMSKLENPVVVSLGERDMKGCTGKVRIYGLLPAELRGREGSCKAEAADKMAGKQALTKPTVENKRFASPGVIDRRLSNSERMTDTPVSGDKSLSQAGSGSGNLSHRLKVTSAATMVQARIPCGTTTADWRSALQHFYAAAEEGALQTGGVLIEARGTSLLAGFNVARHCRLHARKAVRYASLLTTTYEGRMGASELPGDSGDAAESLAGDKLPVYFGVCSGAVAHGTISGRRSSHAVTAGTATEVSLVLCQLCDELRAGVLAAEIGVAQGIPSISMTAAHCRPIDVLFVPQVVDGTKRVVGIMCFELQMSPSFRRSVVSPTALPADAPGTWMQSVRRPLVTLLLRFAGQEGIDMSACMAALKRQGDSELLDEPDDAVIAAVERMPSEFPKDAVLSTVVKRLTERRIGRYVGCPPALDPDTYRAGRGELRLDGMEVERQNTMPSSAAQSPRSIAGGWMHTVTLYNEGLPTTPLDTSPGSRALSSIVGNPLLAPRTQNPPGAVG
eukprot:TRINITY_DN1184_c0_g1_i1.p1 TRINITY_DN1184_c0_g1~~TRINITY_DN1184_c0_g1_i1.p1  ORF type:complete len:3003 (+),score=803.35 TRINITY_DN1184_c0_g1_i1:42-9011(+)